MLWWYWYLYCRYQDCWIDDWLTSCCKRQRWRWVRLSEREGAAVCNVSLNVAPTYMCHVCCFHHIWCSVPTTINMTLSVYIFQRLIRPLYGFHWTSPQLYLCFYLSSICSNLYPLTPKRPPAHPSISRDSYFTQASAGIIEKMGALAPPRKKTKMDESAIPYPNKPSRRRLVVTFHKTQLVFKCENCSINVEK